MDSLDRLKIAVNTAISLRDAGLLLPMNEQDLSHQMPIPNGLDFVIGDFGIVLLGKEKAAAGLYKTAEMDQRSLLHPIPKQKFP